MPAIKALAHLNELTKDVTNDYYLTPEIRATLYMDGIIKRLAAKEIATHNVNGAAFVDLFFKECILAVAEGNSVVSPLFRSSISIQGTVYDYDLGHPISGDRLNFSINLTQGDEARKPIKEVSVDVHREADSASPVIQSILDPNKQKADTLYSGNMVLIQGLNIALRGTDPSIGITFTPAQANDRSEEVPLLEVTDIFIAPDKVFPNTNTKLQFVLPADVKPGTWTVKIVTQSSGNSQQLSKEVRTSEYTRVITVE